MVSFKFFYVFGDDMGGDELLIEGCKWCIFFIFDYLYVIDMV